jgi:hypothetical protein
VELVTIAITSYAKNAVKLTANTNFREVRMTIIQTITEESQLTDSEGWTYREDDSRPSYVLPQIMNLLYTTELEEELDWHEQLKLAVYVSNVAAFDDLTPERLNELYQESEENFEGEFANEGEFAEEFLTRCGDLDSRATENLVIDWQGTYDYAFQFDYFNVFVMAKNEETRALEVQRFFWRNA